VAKLANEDPSLRYLVRKKQIEQNWVEQDLALLAVGYLNFPQLQARGDHDDVRGWLLKGTYAFYDYAVVCWVLHLLAALSEPSLGNFLTDISEGLEVFLDLHWNEAAGEHHATKTLEEKLRPLRAFAEYGRLSRAVVSSKRQLAAHSSGPAADDALDLKDVTSSLRGALEEVAGSGDQSERERITTFYGSAVYKCPRPNCQHFFDGFATAQERNQHVSRHERPFLCSIENCPMGSFGCVTKAALENHMWETHGIYISTTEEFPDILKRSRKRSADAAATFSCHVCHRRYTQNKNLRAHLRTHTEQSFACPVCHKTFARKYDCGRHQRAHSGENVFSCAGVLNNGTRWGCNRSFARADILKEHFRTKAGRQCTRPLRLQELEQKRLVETGLTPDLRELEADLDALEDAGDNDDCWWRLIPTLAQAEILANSLKDLPEAYLESGSVAEP